MIKPVTQEWTHTLPLMQQTVLLTAIRGADGVNKDHPSKLLLRWFRRCVLLSAMDYTVLSTPFEVGGGSFTGPSIVNPKPSVSNGIQDWAADMDALVTKYMRHCDEVPHHFQLHFLHAAEILGYKHPTNEIRAWWRKTYVRLCNDMHVRPEPPEEMDLRLSDNFEEWSKRDEVKALEPLPIR